MTKVLVFGSRSLTAKHLPAMRWHMLAASAYRTDTEDMGPIPLDWIGSMLEGRFPADARFYDSLTLIHGDGPPGKAAGSIGANKLAEVAASLEWPDRRRVRRFPPDPQQGENWGDAATRRNSEMVAMRPDFALCFHTDVNLGRGSADTARKLKAAGLGFRLVLMTQAGEVLKVEDR